MNKLKCINCGNDFEVTDRRKANKYCSADCYHKHSRLERIIVPCHYCQAKLSQYPIKVKKYKDKGKNFFCNHICLKKWWSAQSKVEIICQNCNKPFIISRGDVTDKRRFCSRHCHYGYKDVINHLKVSCFQCNKEILVTEKFSKKRKKYFCSRECFRNYRLRGKWAIFNCGFCNKEIERLKSRFKRVKHSFFCCLSCASKWAQANKCSGSNRSKMEQWIEENLTISFPELEIEYNNKNVCGTYELDVYIPSLKLAFELNGILHYEDIFGGLQVKKENDAKKLQICKEKGIDLTVYDTRSAKRFERNISLGIPFLNDITNRIKEKMGGISSAAHGLNT